MNLRGERRIAEWLEGLGRHTLSATALVASLFAFGVKWRGLLCQTCFFGVKSRSVVSVTDAFTDLALGAQAAGEGIGAPVGLL